MKEVKATIICKNNKSQGYALAAKLNDFKKSGIRNSVSID